MSARILIVDDNPLNIKLLAARLQRDYYLVETAADGFAALDAVRRNIPDLILLDVMMPGMDGFEVCRKLKEDNTLKHVPVVMVTALTDVSDRVQGLLAGADDFLSKPINEVALLARVRSLLRLKLMMDEWRLRERANAQFGNDPAGIDPVEEKAAGAKLLYVGSDQVEQQKMAQALGAEQINLDQARTNAEALELLKTRPYEALLLGMQLNDESALHLIAELRAAEATRHVPVVLVADDVEILKVAKGLELGATDYILRPVDNNELLARTRTQIKQTRTYQRLRENYERSISMALTDPLTGAFNRRYLDMHLGRLFDRAKLGNKPLSVLMVDIDHFKKINDTYGHQVGDEVLKELVQRLNQNLRSFDWVARYGGEEFMVTLPEATPEILQMVADRLLTAVRGKRFHIPRLGQEIAITISLGGATALAEETVKDLQDRADKNLYAAKHAGRDRAMIT